MMQGDETVNTRRIQKCQEMAGGRSGRGKWVHPPGRGHIALGEARRSTVLATKAALGAGMQHLMPVPHGVKSSAWIALLP